MTALERNSVREALEDAMESYPGVDAECATRIDALIVGKNWIRDRLESGLTIHAAAWNLQCSIFSERKVEHV